jgi:hypothetical protein
VIEDAVYGVPYGPESNLTTLVRKLAAGTRGQILVDNGTLRGDPAPYRRKRLKVKVTGRGIIEAWEGEILQIPFAPSACGNVEGRGKGQ